MADRLKELFRRWQGSREEYKDNFTYDGIVDESKWGDAKKKVAIVIKETYDFPVGDLRQHIRENRNSGKIWHHTGRWVYGIQETTIEKMPSLAEADKNRADALLSCAVVNVKKKSSDTWQSKDDEIRRYAENDAKFIKEEIELIDPEVIVCGNTFDVLKDILKVDVGKCATPADNDTFIHNGKVIISTWHPSWYVVPNIMFYYTICAQYQQVLRVAG